MPHRPPPRELLPRPLRIALGATGLDVGDAALRDAVLGKIVLITGASSGVGEATARRLAAAGAVVCVAARREERLNALRDEIEDAGGSAHVYPTDLADPERVEELAAAVLGQHGHVDVVVSNAGLSIRRWVSASYGRFHDIQRTNAVNYLGPTQLLLALLPSMRERGSGHIVNIATAGVLLPAVEWSAYVASKSALEAWLRAVAPEIRADGVETTSIMLQLVRTEMVGPQRGWRYVPAMSADEAAGMVARAIVERPRTVMPWWVRATAPLRAVTQVPSERAQAVYSQLANPASRPSGPVGLAAAAAGRAARTADQALGALWTIRSSNAVRPVRPDRLARAALAARRFGATPAAAVAAAAQLHPRRRAVIDDDGSVTFAELDARGRSLAAALHARLSLRAGSRVAIMCRNHRGFVDAAVAASRLGCDLVLLNTDYAAPQLGDVLARERVDAAIYDEEYDELFAASGFGGGRIIAGHSGEPRQPTLEALIGVGGAPPPPPSSPSRVVLMTSGTTGTPKGVARGGDGGMPRIDPRRVVPAALDGFLSLARIKPTPRSGAPFVVGPPLFHMYGFVALMAAFAYGSPIVIARRFDPEWVLAAIERERAEIAGVVPTMLKRIMDLPDDVRSGYDTSSLRMVTCGAAPLPPELATAFMDEFGDVLYNMYASTESGGGTMATPRDLRAAPGTVGRPTAGVILRILDEDGRELPAGETGRIFISSVLTFSGYSDGTNKDFVDGLMRSGDIGHLDKRGRLFIEGRDDEMILSGGENVYPQEVEDVLLAHSAVADAAVVGVDDEDFGQRLAAVVVLKPGASASVRRAARLRGCVAGPVQGAARGDLRGRAAADVDGEAAAAGCRGLLTSTAAMRVSGSGSGCGLAEPGASHTYDSRVVSPNSR